MAGSKWNDQSGVSSSDADPDNLPVDRETGIVEKLLTTYGFIRCCDRQARIFFHYTQYNGNVEHLKVGDPVDFEMNYDKKSGKPIAISVSKICSDISANLGQQKVTGVVTTELSPEGKGGRVAYENCGECFFFEFSRKDLVDPILDKPRQGQTVQFAITQDVAGNMHVREVRSVAASNLSTNTAPRKHQQQFITTPMVYPGMMVPLVSGVPMVSAYNLASQLVQQSSGTNSHTLPALNGNSRADAEGAASHSQAQSLITKSLKPTPTTMHSNGQQQTGSIQHFSGQSTKQQNQQPGHQTAAPSSPNYQGTTPATNVAARNGQKNVKNSHDQQAEDDQQPAKRYQGVVCSIKEAYGFVERADVVKEIFFHYTEGYQGIQPGDDVSFNITMRNNREVAVNLQRLPGGTVVFEDINERVRKGTITRNCNQTEEPLDGRLTYEDNGEKKELGFGDRDIQPAMWTMKPGDPVEFQIATDRRDALERATNIVMDVRATGAFSKETRLTGTVVSLKDNFGFINAHHDDTEYYFKLNEVLDPELRMDSVVQFTVGTDSTSAGNSRVAAIRICKPPQGKKKASRKAKYTNRGYIVALKDHFGFIESENRQEDLFFHFSIFDGDVNNLKIGSEVEYGLMNKNQRPSAECVRLIDDGIIPGVELLSNEIHIGKVTRSLRCFNPEQVPYCGLLQIKSSDIDNKATGDVTENAVDSNANEKSDGEEYEFSVMSLAKPGEVMQKGSAVEFQLAKSKITDKVIAVNVCLIRERKTATVESVKGQVVYLNFEVDNGKKLTFLSNEAKLNVSLSPGDLVEFDFIRGRNNKWGATNVSRIKGKEASPRPASLVNRYKSLAVSDDGPRVIVIRQPKGPDGTKGFLLQAVSA